MWITLYAIITICYEWLWITLLISSSTTSCVLLIKEIAISGIMIWNWYLDWMGEKNVVSLSGLALKWFITFPLSIIISHFQKKSWKLYIWDCAMLGHLRVLYCILYTHNFTVNSFRCHMLTLLLLYANLDFNDDIKLCMHTDV